MERDPFSGLGKPEPLKYQWNGYWSRRIDDYNRIIYRVKDGKLEIAQCGAHYDDSITTTENVTLNERRGVFLLS
ncbi:MAG: Txe/YoeB family addiction module toxin [Clostridiales bacterium]|nr:Txe/YoeB family addiction module toxin [Clostridiales bacterium]